MDYISIVKQFDIDCGEPDEKRILRYADIDRKNEEHKQKIYARIAKEQKRKQEVLHHYDSFQQFDRPIKRNKSFFK